MVGTYFHFILEFYNHLAIGIGFIYFTITGYNFNYAKTPKKILQNMN